jgi:hypothetical protein
MTTIAHASRPYEAEDGVRTRAMVWLVAAVGP